MSCRTCSPGSRWPCSTFLRRAISKYALNRLPLDLQFVFTANPEDYTNRGSIVTPLKDRIGSQILTHYPEDLETAMQITAQEASLTDFQREAIHLPEWARELVEQIVFQARESEFIDAKSGVSARLSVTALENLMSTAERRARKNGESRTTVRLTDFMGVVPSITGKVELVYEGEQQGSMAVAERLIGEAVKAMHPRYFPPLDKLKASDEASLIKACSIGSARERPWNLNTIWTIGICRCAGKLYAGTAICSGAEGGAIGRAFRLK